MTRVRKLLKQGVSVLLVEQNIFAALSVASRVLVLRLGQIIWLNRLRPWLHAVVVKICGNYFNQIGNDLMVERTGSIVR
jgi:ABC-type branched-subunit amino acid transport system ATPase component